MKNNKLTKWAALLAILGGSAVTPLLAQQSLYVNGTAYPAESGMTYTATSRSYAALQVRGTSAAGLHGSYSGTNIIVSTTFSSTNAADYPVARFGVYVYDGGYLSLHSSTIATSGTWKAIGMYLDNSTADSEVDLHDVTIITKGGESTGLQTIYANIVTGERLTIVTAGYYAHGAYLAHGTIADSTIITSGSRAFGVATGNAYSGTATVDVLNTKIRTNGEASAGAAFAGQYTLPVQRVMRLTAVEVETFGANADAISFAASVGALDILLVDGGSFTAHQGSAIGQEQTVISTEAMLRSYSGTYDAIIRGGANLTGTTVMNLTNLHTAVDNGVVVAVPTTVILRVTEESVLDGGFNLEGTVSSTVSISGSSSLSGGITGSGSSSTMVTVDHSTLTGDLTGNEDANLTVTVSGQDGSFIGDIAQHDEAAVTVIISDGATGRGGINGGNLITGGDSAWTFDKDSHGNYGENHGTWNLGDYDVTFDNLDHAGTITISVNSDTGAGGSITVSGTADGEGKVHIDTTGNGQLNPNDVLPDIVSGDGTEHWQWDPVNWGIDQLIKDGDRFVKNGTSPAGAVLNSSVAIQQAMWFAQQNSLLKRMGELRYGARASRPLAGGTPAFHIIDNIWLRSYGQQLNVGSQVAGKAYEQLIYGVDLGTDHKFTISADSDLYLGVYAGSGRSDIDYRTPGADGEINSYYGGLYATWLHSSGFYIDATFKAASVNNDLKAPYGNTQLKASYSDVNLGGSIELGKKFTFADDWFIEPQLQVNYLHILAEDYQAGPMTISAQDLDALQLRIGSVFGRTINLTNSGALQPYIKISGVETISSGGVIRNGYQSTRANTDGARAELGGGIIWQLDTNNQLHLDYEASFGDKYDKPWGLTAGYRHQF